MQTYTVRQLAELVQKPNEKIGITIDRLAHWTDENMLTVHGDRNPGTGRKRLYERTALFEALTLSLLSEAVGSPVTSPEFIKVFQASRPLQFATQAKGSVGCTQSRKVYRKLSARSPRSNRLVDTGRSNKEV